MKKLNSKELIFIGVMFIILCVCIIIVLQSGMLSTFAFFCVPGPNNTEVCTIVF